MRKRQIRCVTHLNSLTKTIIKTLIYHTQVSQTLVNFSKQRSHQQQLKNTNNIATITTTNTQQRKQRET